MNAPLNDSWRVFCKKQLPLIEAALRNIFPLSTTKPSIVEEAMLYSLFSGGKRLRPLLCLAAAQACARRKFSFQLLQPLLCALECLHTYSLIHDDLPAMDDDDWRRGQLTCHKVFGEGIAILAGDALLTLSFELLAQMSVPKRYSLQLFLQEMAHAAGHQELIAGQASDLQSEERTIDLGELTLIHQRKTAALITLSLRFGAMSVRATTQQLEAVTLFGKALGLAFQIVDDILDEVESSQTHSKSTKRDDLVKKASYPSLLGLSAAKDEAAKQTRIALQALEPLGAKGKILESMAKELLERRY